MGRDFEALLAATPCWDRQTQRRYDELGVPVHDVALQARSELIARCRSRVAAGRDA